MVCRGQLESTILQNNRHAQVRQVKSQLEGTMRTMRLRSSANWWTLPWDLYIIIVEIRKSQLHNVRCFVFLTAACFCALSMVFAEIGRSYFFLQFEKSALCDVTKQTAAPLIPLYLCTPHSGSPCDCPIQTRGGIVQETIFTDNSKQRAKCAVLDLQCFEFIHLTKLCWITGWKIKSLKIMGPFNLTRAKNNEIWSFC